MTSQDRQYLARMVSVLNARLGVKLDIAEDAYGFGLGIILGDGGWYTLLTGATLGELRAHLDGMAVVTSMDRIKERLNIN